MDILVFKIDSQQFAVNLSLIERVIRIVLITKQPNVALGLAGIINLHGEVIPVIDFRSLIGLKIKEIDLSDQLIICHVLGKKMALWIDSVKQIESPLPDQISPANHASKDESLESIIKKGQEVILYYNLEKLLSAKTDLFSHSQTTIGV